MSTQLDLIEVSDFLVERVRPRTSVPLRLPGGDVPRDLDDIVVSDPGLVVAGCCCCCCCCNCNSGGGAVLQTPIPEFANLSSSVIAVQPGPAERRSKLAPKSVTFFAPEKSPALTGSRVWMSGSSLTYSLEVDGAPKDSFITHTWYGPDRTIRFGGLTEKGVAENFSTLPLDGQCEGIWKVIARDISGAIISFTVFELYGGEMRIIESEFSPIAATLAEIRVSIDTPAPKEGIFSPRLNRLYFVTELDSDVSPDQIQHAWYKGNALMAILDPEERDGRLVSRFVLPSNALGGWYAVAIDEVGRHITTASFSVRSA